MDTFVQSPRVERTASAIDKSTDIIFDGLGNMSFPQALEPPSGKGGLLEGVAVFKRWEVSLRRKAVPLQQNSPASIKDAGEVDSTLDGRKDIGAGVQGLDDGSDPAESLGRNQIRLVDDDLRASEE